MAVYFNGLLVIESAIIYCRALLEFLGLQASRTSKTEITERGKRQMPDDLGIEQFSDLPKVSKAKAMLAYPASYAR